MNNELPKRHPIQFSLRKLLLWIALVAMCLGIPTAFGQSPAIWFVLTCWCAAIGSLQSRFGRPPAALVSIVGAGLLASVASVVADERWPADYVASATEGFVNGVAVGFALFVILEIVSVVVNWIDRLFHRGVRTRVNWLVLGMLCGMALAVMEPQTCVRGYYRGTMLQQTASTLYWYSLAGMAIGATCDLLQNPPTADSFRIGFRTMLLAMLTWGSFVIGWFLYLRIVGLEYS